MWRPYLERKARELYGHRWFLADKKPKPGKRRKRMRDAARHLLLMQEARLQGLSCETCHSFNRQTPMMKGVAHCERGSDFHGYLIATQDGLCSGRSEMQP